MVTKSGIDPTDLTQAGWGLILAADADPAILEALSRLRVYRRMQAGGRYKEYYKAGKKDEEHKWDGYHAGESKPGFLARRGVKPGPADPEQMPYYLLIVGDPESIPYEFQYRLGVQYAVGRIHFPTLDEYAAYADTVVAAETGRLSLPRRVALFGTHNHGDPATQLCSAYLIQPLAERLAQHADWSVETVLGREATKASLARLLGGEATPGVLLTASHGIGFPQGDPRQLLQQGALLCQDWPGPSAGQPVAPQQYFAAADVQEDAHLHGLISIHYASYSAGTPREDDFALQALQRPARIAPRAFVASLPQRLLSHPGGGAVAVVGQVGRAWAYSFRSARIGQQTQVYGDLLTALLDGYPVGHAMESLSAQSASSAAELGSELEAVGYGKAPDDVVLSSLWTSANDARNTMVVGDPAARLLPG
jgi:hypothetical protein